jgi:hypothetical protein
MWRELAGRGGADSCESAWTAGAAAAAARRDQQEPEPLRLVQTAAQQNCRGDRKKVKTLKSMFFLSYGAN